MNVVIRTTPKKYLEDKGLNLIGMYITSREDVPPIHNPETPRTCAETEQVIIDTLWETKKKALESVYTCYYKNYVDMEFDTPILLYCELFRDTDNTIYAKALICDARGVLISERPTIFVPDNTEV